MNIIILGAGQVGSTIAENLANGKNDVTLVDIDHKILSSLQDRLDIKTINGYASHPAVLEQAGADDADMILAVTSSDETNIVACQIAYTLFKTPQKIARVRNLAYLSRPELFADKDAPVDLLISPENVVTEFIYKIVELPGSQQVMDFADGLIKVVSVKAHTGGLMVGHEIQDIHQNLPDIETRIIGIFRHGHPVLPTPETKIKENDLIYFITATGNIPEVMRQMRRKDKPYKKIIIAGGGNIGMLLAKKLEEQDYQVKIIEIDPSKTVALSEYLNESIVLLGDAADKELLLEENIENTDAFIAVTSADEANILSSMLAKRLGVHKVMTLINRPSYVNLVESDVIDVAISPKQITISTLLARVRSNNVISAHALRNTISEVIEIIAKGDPETSKVIGKPIKDIPLPKTSYIVAIVRDEKIIMEHSDLVIEQDDRVIMMIIDRFKSHEVESLFF